MVADVLALYGAEHATKLAHPELVGFHVKPLIEYWGEKTCDEISGETCREYVEKRTAGKIILFGRGAH